MTADTWSRIHRAAVARFAEHGFAATGIRQIADDVGLTTASLYHHMGSKDDLLHDIVISSLSALVDGAGLVVAETSDPIDQLAGLVRLHVVVHASHGQEAIVVDTQFGQLSDSSRALAVELRDRYELIWRDVLARGARDDDFQVPDVHLASLFLLGSCTAVAEWYRSAGRLDPNKLADEYVLMTLAAVNSRRAAVHRIGADDVIDAALRLFENRIDPTRRTST